jgi:hypothetical protein
MPPASTSSFAVFILAAVGPYARAGGDSRTFVVPNVPDLTIKTRETTDVPESTVRTNTLYFKGAWERREMELQFPSALPAQRTVRRTTITRCDERRILELNHDAQLYGWSPLNPIGKDVYGVRSRWRQTPETTAVGVDVKITITTEDTGERRQMGPYSARHLVTTITTDPSPGANARASESIEDGWHIDLPHVGCWTAGDGHLLATGSRVGPDGVTDRLNVEFRGAGRRGFPIEETARHRSENEPTITTRVKLLEFSEALIDKSLFDVPAGYRPALPRLIGHLDMTTPDRVANRLAGYWHDATTLTRDFFGF